MSKTPYERSLSEERTILAALSWWRRWVAIYWDRQQDKHDFESSYDEEEHYDKDFDTFDDCLTLAGITGKFGENGFWGEDPSRTCSDEEIESMILTLQGELRSKYEQENIQAKNGPAKDGPAT